MTVQVQGGTYKMGAAVRREGEATAERAAERVAGGAAVVVAAVGVDTTGEVA